MGSYYLTFACLLVGLAICHGYGYSDEYDGSKGRRGTSCKCGWANKESGRIVGGVETKVNEYPHMVLLCAQSSRGLSPFCGASIITERAAITAAHCTYDNNNQLAIIAGEHDFTTSYETRHTKVYSISRVINHEQYNPRSVANDIALLLTSEPIEFNQNVGPICMPTDTFNLENKRVKVTGWGHRQWKGQVSPVLNKVYLDVVNTARCSSHYGNSLTHNQFCTYGVGKDSCQGDSGGPVTYLDPETKAYTLVGLVSFGKECAGPSPGVNTHVVYHMDWVRSKLPGSRLCYKL